jgi:hypothetical protein
MSIEIMRLNQWAALIVVTGVILIVVHGLWGDVFKVDYYTVVILLFLCVPYFSQFLKKAKIAGAEFEFRDEIESTKKVVQESIEKSKSLSKSETKPSRFVTFDVETAKAILSKDPVLALASLRIEIEKKLNFAARFFGINSKYTLLQIVDELRGRGVLRSEQTSALRKIIGMCNKAIHGYEVSEAEARDIIKLMEELNQSFSIGYFLNFTPNPNFEKQGLECEWEHCIEFMPLTARATKKSCPIFGHNCPGGIEKVAECTPHRLESLAKILQKLPRNKE